MFFLLFYLLHLEWSFTLEQVLPLSLCSSSQFVLSAFWCLCTWLNGFSQRMRDLRRWVRYICKLPLRLIYTLCSFTICWMYTIRVFFLVQLCIFIGNKTLLIKCKWYNTRTRCPLTENNQRQKSSFAFVNQQTKTSKATTLGNF